jgi:hypothetical protein
VAFGEPMGVVVAADDDAAALERLRGAYGALYAEVREASGLGVADSPWR